MIITGPIQIEFDEDETIFRLSNKTAIEFFEDILQRASTYILLKCITLVKVMLIIVLVLTSYRI